MKEGNARWIVEQVLIGWRTSLIPAQINWPQGLNGLSVAHLHAAFTCMCTSSDHTLYLVQPPIHQMEIVFYDVINLL